MTLRAILADDHTVIREGLRRLIEAECHVRVVGEADDGRDAVDLVRELEPDLAIMDITMPELNGVEATRQIRKLDVPTRVVILSAYGDQRFVLEALDAGAAAYVLKADLSAELVEAVRAVSNGRRYLSSAITGVVVDGYVGRVVRPEHTASRVLSNREREVLQLVAEGLTSPQIGRRLHVAVKTVEAHRRNIMDKLDLHSIAELTKYAVREGLTTP